MTGRTIDRVWVVIREVGAADGPVGTIGSVWPTKEGAEGELRRLQRVREQYDLARAAWAVEHEKNYPQEPPEMPDDLADRVSIVEIPLSEPGEWWNNGERGWL